MYVHSWYMVGNDGGGDGQVSTQNTGNLQPSWRNNRQLMKPTLEVAVNLEVEVQKAELDLELCENLENSSLLSRRRRKRWKRICSNQLETKEGEKIFGK